MKSYYFFNTSMCANLNVWLCRDRMIELLKGQGSLLSGLISQFNYRISNSITQMRTQTITGRSKHLF